MSKKITKKERKRQIEEAKLNKPYLEKIADYIIKNLKRYGIHILRYDSKSTESIYLKFDYGMSGSLRISSHEGKKNLVYTFNLIQGLKKPYIKKCKSSNGYNLERYYYPDSLTKNLVGDIIRYKKFRVSKYGKDNYAKYMHRNKGYVGKGDKFWFYCKEV